MKSYTAIYCHTNEEPSDGHYWTRQSENIADELWALYSWVRDQEKGKLKNRRT